MTIAVKKHAKLHITFLKSCPILLYLFSLCPSYCLELFEETNLSPKLDFTKLSTLSISCFLEELVFLRQSWYFFLKFESSLEEERAKENLQTIFVIIFWHILITSLRSESLQVKRCLISSIRNLLHDLPHDLLNDLRLSILRNQEILEKKSNTSGDAAKCPVFL